MLVVATKAPAATTKKAVIFLFLVVAFKIGALNLCLLMRRKDLHVMLPIAHSPRRGVPNNQKQLLLCVWLIGTEACGLESAVVAEGDGRVAGKELP